MRALQKATLEKAARELSGLARAEQKIRRLEMSFTRNTPKVRHCNAPAIVKNGAQLERIAAIFHSSNATRNFA